MITLKFTVTILLSAVLMSCVSPDSKSKLGYSTPDETLAKYIRANNSKQLDSVKSCFVDSSRDYQFGDSSVKNVRYEIIKIDTITAAEAYKYDFTPKPIAGDIWYDVLETFEDSSTNTYFYCFRMIDNRWLIYSWGANGDEADITE